jgi:hypothetical protein
MKPGKDHLPAEILGSSVFTERHLNQLASLPELPQVDPSFEDEHLKYIVYYYSLNPQDMVKETHIYAASLLDQGRVYDAWQVLLLSGDMM